MLNGSVNVKATPVTRRPSTRQKIRRVTRVLVCFVPRLGAILHMFHCVELNRLQNILSYAATNIGKYSIEEASIAYMESTVVDISMTLPSFKFVSFSSL